MPNQRDALAMSLARIGQQHALRFAEQLDEAGRSRIGGQLASLDLDAIAELVQTQVRRKAAIALPSLGAPASRYCTALRLEAPGMFCTTMPGCPDK